MNGLRTLLSRFTAAPADCGEEPPRPRMHGPSFLAETSPDQRRIEAVLEDLVQPGHVLLHVGVGASTLAARFAERVRRIDGITIRADERAKAVALDLPNYAVTLRGKYGRGLAGMGPYDLVVDNNPTSYACCRRHADELMDTYAALLAPGGRLLTDRVGAGWAEPHGFGIGWDEWRAVAERLGLRAERLTDDVWALGRA